MSLARDGGSCGSATTQQKGMTLISFLLMMTVGGFVALFAVRVAPIYFDHYLIRTTVESLEKDPDLQTKTKEEILTLLQNRWDINNIDTVRAKDVKISREEGNIGLRLKYEVSKNVFGNLDVLVHFDDQFLIPSKR